MISEKATSSPSNVGFDTYLDALIAYRVEHGSYDVPEYYSVPGDHGPVLLGVWVACARQAYKLDLLPRCREEAFRALPGWTFGSKLSGRKFDHEQAYRDYCAGMGVAELATKNRVHKETIQRMIVKESGHRGTERSGECG